jgi:hypothetical protein
MYSPSRRSSEAVTSDAGHSVHAPHFLITGRP